MIEFLSTISDILFVLLIVSSVLFGLSFAVRFYVINTVKKIVRESDKNFDEYVKNEENFKCKSTVSSHVERYTLFAEAQAKNNKIKRRNKIRKIFHLKQKPELDVSDSLKDISLSLVKDVSSNFEGAGGYLNYSKNELIVMLKKLCERLNVIFDKSGIIWLKTVKISTIVQVIAFTKNIEKFKGKTAVIIITSIIDFCFFVSRFFSPVGASKKLVNSVMDSSFSTLITTASFNVVGKEWAVLCAEKERSRLALNSDKKVA